MPLFERGPAAEAAPMECPHDGTPMERLVVERVPLDRCGSCGGTWFDADELRRATRDPDLEALVTRVPVNASESAFRCPRCGGRCMEASVAGVELDHCLECRGVWLDRGELAEAKRRMKAERVARADAFSRILARL